MQLNGKRYDVDGTVTDVTVRLATYLKDLQAAIGGYIEIVKPRGVLDDGRPLVMVVDEEGLVKNRPLNPMGCALYGTVVHGQPIAGPIVVFDREAFMAFDRLLEDT